MFEHYKHDTLQCIYTITLDGKKYVGRTGDTRGTYTLLTGNVSTGPSYRYIRNAIHAHGSEHAKMETLLVDLAPGEAASLQKHYIKILGTLAPAGYNLKNDN